MQGLIVLVAAIVLVMAAIKLLDKELTATECFYGALIVLLVAFLVVAAVVKP